MCIYIYVSSYIYIYICIWSLGSLNRCPEWIRSRFRVNSHKDHMARSILFERLGLGPHMRAHIILWDVVP